MRWLRSISQPVQADDGSTVWDGLILDITEQRRAEGELRHLAMHDRLTGLPNVTAFDERLDDAIVQTADSGGCMLVGALDVNRFYAVNEIYGARFGDEALQRVGERLQSRLYGNDVVARYEGDEFLLFQQGLHNAEACLRKAQELVALFQAPLPLSSGDFVPVSVSLGFAVFPTDGQASQALRRKADLALQRARKNADTVFQFYSDRMSEEVIEAVQLERQLTDAIDQRRILPWYQGQYDLRTGKLIGMEVLARWLLPDGAFISPGRFIPLGEETGLIHPMTEVLVERVLTDLRVWKDAGAAVPRVAINVSAHQVRFPSFFDWLIEKLETHGLGVEDLTVEITESAFLLDFAAVREILESLSARGVRLSIDDFGTGYSSLSYLSQLPFRELKIDRAFVAEVDTSDTRLAVARGIIQLGHSLGLEVVAEGVETRGQLECLQWLDCDFAQGFHLGRPAPGEAFRE